ncbi:HIT family protein [Rhodanobacter sp. L36]|uniref:HIT domain-containing protein n=1 Tax=Rhodanobacter sp. L36 TaxID=1747221 RepID=UPI00131E5F98|nr:HIT family protein [Rhodanobacter sp. L36]
MSDSEFVLDARLTADSHPVATLPLCDVRLMNDARYPWLILVPRRSSMIEIAELPESDQATLWQEVNRAAAALRSTTPCEKINIGALGNIVRQLHVHVVARNQGDAAWPGPVWGHGMAKPYEAPPCDTLIERLRKALKS